MQSWYKKYDTGVSYSNFWRNDKDSYYGGGYRRDNSSDEWTNRFMPNSVYGSASDVHMHSIEQAIKIQKDAVNLCHNQRAIANFIKIMTGKDIPVLFKGDSSYTDMTKVVVIAASVNDETFDTQVGLALHESSHIIYTDDKAWKNALDDYNFDLRAYNLIFPATTSYSELLQFFKSLMNWIEDRRIDDLVFRSSPGYKAYYHKLYDYYFNDRIVQKAVQSDIHTNPQLLDDWQFNIINSLCATFNPSRLKGLPGALKLIDVPNIKRLKSTEDVVELTDQLVRYIAQQMTSGIKDNSQSQQDPNNSSNSAIDQGDDDDNDSNNPGDQDDNSNNGFGSGDADNDVDDFTPSQSLTAKDETNLKKAVESIEDLINGTVNKDPKAGYKDKRTLQKSSEFATILASYNVQSIQSEDWFTKANTGKNKTNSHIPAYAFHADWTKSPHYQHWNNIFATYMREAGTRTTDSWDTESIDTLIPLLHRTNKLTQRYSANHAFSLYQEGLRTGAMLSNKLKTFGELNSRVDMRLCKGKVDARRLNQAGMDIESIFKQVTNQQSKPAHIHISIDGSGSMSSGTGGDGSLWDNALKFTVAIARAIQGKSKLSLSVSVRTTDNTAFATGSSGMHTGVVVKLWDSRTANIAALAGMLSVITLSSSTPDGLCFEALYHSNIIENSSERSDSYLINISDGQPQTNPTLKLNDDFKRSQEKQLSKWWKKVKNKTKVKACTYYIYSQKSGQPTGIKEMLTNIYGEDSRMVQGGNMMSIANTVNRQLITSYIAV